VKSNINMYSLFVPCTMNDKPVRRKHHLEWDKWVQKITGGMTILAPSRGKWKSPKGIVFEERMIPVMIACGDKDIVRIVKFTINHYKQEAVMYFKLGEAEIVHKE